MFRTNYQEFVADDPAVTKPSGSIFSTGRRSIGHLQGRFCFEFGVAARCFETEVTLTEGEIHTLRLSLTPKWAGLAVETKFELQRTIKYAVGQCDSVDPAVVFDDATVRVYERSANAFGLRWSAFETEWDPGSQRPFITANKILDDPECGCSGAGAPSGSGDDRVSFDIRRSLVRVLSNGVLRSRRRPLLGESHEVAQESLRALAEFLEPTQEGLPEEVGIRDHHGRTTWFGGTFQESGRPMATLITSDPMAAVRGLVLVPQDDAWLDALVLAPVPEAAAALLNLDIFDGGEPKHHLERFLPMACDGRSSVAHALLELDDLAVGGGGTFGVQFLDARGTIISEMPPEAFEVVPALDSGTTDAYTRDEEPDSSGRRRASRATGSGDWKDSPPKRTGIVKWFSDEKGVGLITPDDGGRDLLVYLSGIAEGFSSLAAGARVEFEVELAEDASERGDVPRITNATPSDEL